MPRSLSQSIDTIARQSIGKDWGLYATLLDHWAEIVGKEYAENTTPVKITFPHQPQEQRRISGTLTIKLPKGLAMEFTFKNEVVRQRINAYFGYDAIAKITLAPAVIEPPAPKRVEKTVDKAQLDKLHQETDVLENKELADSLRSFGETLLRHSDA